MRIRTIKPEFFSHPEIVALTIPARLLLVSLLGQADDEGRMYDQPLKIVGQSFGEDDNVRIHDLLGELHEHGRILRYEAQGRRCIQIVNFNKHQTINRPTPSVIPPASLSEPSHAAVVSPPAPLTDDSLGERKGMEGNREQGKEGKELSVIDEAFGRFWQVYPRRVGKVAARKAFDKAITTTPAAVIRAGALRFHEDPNREDEFTPHPATWLNEGRWDDDPLPARSNGKPRRDRALEIAQEAQRRSEAGR